MKLRIRQSSIAEWHRCPRRWLLKVQQNLGPAEVVHSRPLEFGTAFHAGLETWWVHDGSVGERLIAAQQSFAANAVHLSFEDRVLGPTLLTGYAAKYSSEELRLHSMPTAEQKVILPILDPDGNIDPDIEFEGTLDAIGYDDAGRSIIVEHKTTSSNMNNLGFWKRFDRSLQLPLYWIAAVDCGRPPHELILDAVRAPMLHRAKPTPIERREFYKRAPVGGAVGDPKPGTRLTEESREDFEDRLMADISDNPGDYYARKTYAFTEHELLLARADLWAAGRGMLAALRAGGATSRNSGGCEMYNSECEFAAACWGGADLNDKQLYTIRSPR